MTRTSGDIPGQAGAEADPSWLERDQGVPRLRGERVVLREWLAADLPVFAELNADPQVMEYYPSPLTREQSDAFARERVSEFAERGYGLWAVEVPGVAPFVGYVGLSVPSFEAHFTPCVEIGWRLAASHWGKGYATEAARLAIAFGFDHADLEEIVSFTVPSNRRSVAVMKRLGMVYAGEFDHPRMPIGHPLRRHVLYRLSRS
jgi:RimJ/RimL family protein N-acetyltransferase